jgi:hypothetical protein
MLEGLTPPSRQRLCKVELTAQTLEPKDQEILKAAIANLDWTISGLYTELKHRGITISEKAMTAHRKGQCLCSKI